MDKWEGPVQAPARYNLKPFADKETYEAMDELAKLQNKSAHQLAIEVIRNFVAAQQNGKSEWVIWDIAAAAALSANQIVGLFLTCYCLVISGTDEIWVFEIILYSSIGIVLACTGSEFSLNYCELFCPNFLC